MRREGHVPHTEGMGRNSIQGFDGESDGNSHVEALGIDGRVWTGFYLSQIRIRSGLL